jgi:hypothetical protein
VWNDPRVEGRDDQHFHPWRGWNVFPTLVTGPVPPSSPARLPMGSAVLDPAGSSLGGPAGPRFGYQMHILLCLSDGFPRLCRRPRRGPPNGPGQPPTPPPGSAPVRGQRPQRSGGRRQPNRSRPKGGAGREAYLVPRRPRRGITGRTWASAARHSVTTCRRSTRSSGGSWAVRTSIMGAGEALIGGGGAGTAPLSGGRGTPVSSRCERRRRGRGHARSAAATRSRNW